MRASRRSTVSRAAATLRLVRLRRRAHAGGADEGLRDARSASRIVEGYGLSETAPVASVQPSRSAVEARHRRSAAVRRRDPHDCGRPVTSPCRPENAGEVVIRGHNVMKGYYKRAEATAEAMRNGWFHTGDIGILDADGYLSIVDRKKDMILRGGFSVFPRELEEVMLTHPADLARRRHRRAGRATRRGSKGVRGEKPGRRADRRRAARLVQGTVCRLQIPTPHRVPNRAAHQSPPERS